MGSSKLMTINSTDSFKVGNDAQTCSLGSNSQVHTPGVCICQDGFQNVQNKCVACTSLDVNKIGNGAGNDCICKNEYTYINGSCLLCNQTYLNS